MHCMGKNGLAEQRLPVHRRGQRRTGSRKSSPFLSEGIKIFIIPAAVYSDASIFKCIENVLGSLVIRSSSYWGNLRVC